MVVSYFDIKIGPKVLIKHSEDSDIQFNIPEEQIANLMEFHSDGDTFSHCYVKHEKTISLNHCFTIEDKTIRGGRYDLMITILFQKLASIPKNQYLNNIFKNIDILETWIEGISEQIRGESRIRMILKSQNVLRPYKNEEIKNSLIRCLNRNFLSKSKLDQNFIELNN